MTKKRKRSKAASLLDVAPEIATQWHPTRNGYFRPEDISIGSNSRFWWKCDAARDHEWIAQPNNRVGRDSGCPFCAGKQASVTNSLASKYPEIATQWHPTKNGELTPSEIVAGSAEKYWWKCKVSDDHEWKATCNSRTTNNASCPFCDNKFASSTNSLKSRFPRIAAEWHPFKNGTVTPADVVAGSNRLYWWKCDAAGDHQWKASPNSRTGKSSGCPCCAGKKISITNSLETLFPVIARQWHPIWNGTLTPADVVAQSHEPYWWKCDLADDHAWRTSGASRISSNSGCPFCAGKQASVTNSLASKYPEIATQWHPTKNGELTPSEIVAGSAEKYWWKCDIANDHEWYVSVGDRTSYGTGCPFCDGKQVSVTNNLEETCPDVAKQWHPIKNENVRTRDVASGSSKKYWWKCDIANDHEWKTSPSSRTGLKRSGCPCCAGQKISITNSLETLFPVIARQWHPEMNGDVTPAHVQAFSSKYKYWWKCDISDTHEWDAHVSDRTKSGSGCPYCKLTPRSAQEIRLAYELSGLIDFDLEKHKIRIGRKIRDVDIVLEKLNLIIEFDGTYWHQGREEKDKEKTTLLEEGGWTVIRVRERPLESIHENDVIVDVGMATKQVTDLVFLQIANVLQIDIPNLDMYLESSESWREKDSQTAIREYLLEKTKDDS